MGMYCNLDGHGAIELHAQTCAAARAAPGPDAAAAQEALSRRHSQAGHRVVSAKPLGNGSQKGHTAGAPSGSNGLEHLATRICCKH